MPPMTGGEIAAALLRLADVQVELDSLKAERDRLIRETDGHVPVRAIARHLGLSPAQVSRIRSKGATAAPVASQGGV